MSSHRELIEQHDREKTIRRPKTKNLVLHSKKIKKKVHHYQESYQRIRFEEYLPNFFFTKFRCDGTKAICCNVDEKEVKDTTPSCQSPKVAQKSPSKLKIHHVRHKKTFYIYLFDSKMHIWQKSHCLTMIFYLVRHFIIALYSL